MTTIRRDHQPPARDLGADELGRDAFALGHPSHLGGDDVRAGRFELRGGLRHGASLRRYEPGQVRGVGSPALPSQPRAHCGSPSVRRHHAPRATGTVKLEARPRAMCSFTRASGPCRASGCDGDRREWRTVEGSSAGPTEPSRVLGASPANGSHADAPACWAQGARGAIRRVGGHRRVALLTEIGPADEPSTVRSRRRCSRKNTPVERVDRRGAPWDASRAPTSSGVDGAWWRCRRRGRSRSGAPRARVPRRGGSRHECHAPSTDRPPMPPGCPRRADHARRLRSPRRRHLHHARFPTVAGAPTPARARCRSN